VQAHDQSCKVSGAVCLTSHSGLVSGTCGAAGVVAQAQRPQCSAARHLPVQRGSAERAPSVLHAARHVCASTGCMSARHIVHLSKLCSGRALIYPLEYDRVSELHPPKGLDRSKEVLSRPHLLHEAPVLCVRNHTALPAAHARAASRACTPPCCQGLRKGRGLCLQSAPPCGACTRRREGR